MNYEKIERSEFFPFPKILNLVPQSNALQSQEIGIAGI